MPVNMGKTAIELFKALVVLIHMSGIQKIIKSFKGIQMFVLDDAFQHRSIERDLDVVLLNTQAPLSDYKLIPHGLLREPMSHLKRADIIIFTKSDKLQPHQKILNRME